MSSSPELTIDKSTWTDGPWKHEPDRLEWRDEATGLPCLMVRGPVGALCGYVGVVEGHKFFNKRYSQCTLAEPCEESYCEHTPEHILRVHGGITYSAACSGHICHIPKEGEPDSVWWLGFDCAHAGDYTPGIPHSAEYERHLGIGCPTGWGGVIEYRDVGYIKEQCAELAKQLVEIG